MDIKVKYDKVSNKAIEELIESVLKFKSMIAFAETYSKEQLNTDTDSLRERLAEEDEALKKIAEETDIKLKKKILTDADKEKYTEIQMKRQATENEITNTKKIQKDYYKLKTQLVEQLFHLKYLLTNKDELGKGINEVIETDVDLGKKLLDAQKELDKLI